MLTQLQITSAKAKAKPYNLSDGQGLALAVQTNGSKLWRFRYRYAGKQKTLHIGPWPATSLADAREKCREARKALATGLDPALEKKRAKIAARFPVPTTFKEVALEWIAKCEREGRAEITLDKIHWLLGMAYPLIGSHPINTITPIEALSVLRRLEAKGRYESARRMRSILSRVFRYGIATARCDRDVAADLRGALTTPRTVHHAAITDPGDVGVLLKTIDGYSGQAVTRMALRLSPHLFVRPGELRQAEWTEIVSGLGPVPATCETRHATPLVTIFCSAKEVRPNLPDLNCGSGPLAPMTASPIQLRNAPPESGQTTIAFDPRATFRRPMMFLTRRRSKSGPSSWHSQARPRCSSVAAEG